MSTYKVTRVATRRPRNRVTYGRPFSPRELSWLVQWHATELMGLSHRAASSLAQQAEGAVSHLVEGKPNRFSLGSRYTFELERVA